VTTVHDARDFPDVDEAQLLFEEARRRRRRRLWVIAVASVAALSVGTWVVVDSGGGARVGTHPATRSLVGLPADHRSYKPCPGSAEVGSATSPDGLPAQVSRTDDLALAVNDARNMLRGQYLGFTHRVSGLPDRSDVKTIRVGPGGGYVWTRDSTGQVEVVPVKNYGLYVYLNSSLACPTGGWARFVDGGFQVTFLAPTA
jgi:hypothetical protein